MAEEPKVTRANILEACKDMLRWQVYVIHTTPASGLGPDYVTTVATGWLVHRHGKRIPWRRYAR